MGLGFALTAFLVSKLESKNLFDKADRTFTDLEEFVQVRTNSYSRFYNTKGKLVKKSDIVKLQKAGCLTLFTQSDNAIDISVHPSDKEIVFEKAKNIFPKAEVIEIDMES